MNKYDFDTFVKRTVWWRIGNAIVLSLLSLTLIFISQTITNYGEATQNRLDALQRKVDALQQQIDAARSTQAPTALTASGYLSHMPTHEAQHSGDQHLKRILDILQEDIQEALKNHEQHSEK